MGFPCHTVFESFMTSPRLLGEAILSVVTGNAAHYLQSLMLHAAVVSIMVIHHKPSGGRKEMF